jgi:hypothetical protein
MLDFIFKSGLSLFKLVTLVIKLLLCLFARKYFFLNKFWENKLFFNIGNVIENKQ